MNIELQVHFYSLLPESKTGASQLIKWDVFCLLIIYMNQERTYHIQTEKTQSTIENPV